MDHVSRAITQGSDYGISALLRKILDVQEGSVGSHLQQLLKAARLHMGMEVAFISELSGGQRVFRYVDADDDVDLLAVGMGDPIDETYCKKIVDGHLPELIHNAKELEEARSMTVTKELGIGAHLSSPIRLPDGTVFGTFCSFSFRANYELNERDRALMHVFADIASAFIQKDVDRACKEEDTRRRMTGLLESDGIRMLWQPIVELASHSIVGVEALARFSDDDSKGPQEWFVEAASVGLSNEIEARAVAKGLEVIDRLTPNQYVSCNASAAAVLSGAVPEQLRQVPLERVVLEITEHDVIDDYQSLSKALAPLRADGLRLAVDDAGAGYASLKHVVHLRPDLIKLDMSLARDVDSDVARRSLVFCLINFCEAIGARLIAEGVETREELDTLNRIGVHAAQGFFLHRPKELREISELLKADQGKGVLDNLR